MKTFVLTISRVFPATHTRKGEQTDFKNKILKAVRKNVCNSRYGEIGSSCNGCDGRYLFQDYCLEIPKLHTIRANYELWKNRIEQVQKGEAILSIRYWSSKPYHKDENGIGQVEICQLDKDSGVSFQELFNLPSHLYIDGREPVSENTLAKNDGLSLEDFKEWFKGYDISKPMIIIHFTSFRY